MPFTETSAKTNENIEEAFQAVVRDLLGRVEASDERVMHSRR